MSIKDKWGRKDPSLFYDTLSLCIETLTDEQLGEVIRKIYEFSVDGIVYEREDFNDRIVYFPYKQLCNLQENQGEKYAEKVSKLVSNFSGSGGDKTPNGNQMVPNGRIKDKVKDTVIENKSENSVSLAWFDSIWELYPLKRGKHRLTEADFEVLDAVGEDALREAVENYNRDRIDNPTRATMNGDTFFRRGFQDYLPGVYEPEEKAPTVEETEKTKHREADQVELTVLRGELEKVTAELERTDRKKDRERYYALREQEEQLSGKIEALKKRSQA